MNDRWIPDLRRSGGIKYIAIADALAEAIERGEIAPGERLPPQRELAARMGIDLTTVTRAYEMARLRGLIEARGRAGSFVRDPSRIELSSRTVSDAGMNMPPELPKGMLARTIARTMSKLLSNGAAAGLQYQPAGGAREDRVAGAALLTRLGVPADEDQVLVTAGGQNALHAILSSALSPGDAVACGAYVYPGLRTAAERLGLRLCALAQLDAATLERACADEGIKALYVVPTNDNPTTTTLSARERQALAGVAKRHDLCVIEDDAYGPLSATPIPPIASHAPERTWYIVSTSKIISPALRVAFVRAPSLTAGLRLAAALHDTTIMAPPLNVAMVSSWIGDGTFDRLVDAMRTTSASRQALALEILGELDVSGHPQGYHLWLRLPDSVASRDLAELVRPSGLSVMPAERFSAQPSNSSALRISLGGPASPDQLARGLRTLNGYLAMSEVKAAALI